jgi:hypothetical protein
VKADLISEPGCALSGRWALHGVLAHRISIIAAAIMPTISAAMMTMCVGLLMICRSMVNRVPSESSSWPQYGQMPGCLYRTFGCVGQR